MSGVCALPVQLLLVVVLVLVLESRAPLADGALGRRRPTTHATIHSRLTQSLCFRGRVGVRGRGRLGCSKFSHWAARKLHSAAARLPFMQSVLSPLGAPLLFPSSASVHVVDTQTAAVVTELPKAIYIRPFDVAGATF